MRALSIASTGMLAQRDQRRSDRQQSGEHEHHRLQTAAVRISGSALSECDERRAPRPLTRALSRPTASRSAPASKPPRPIASPPRAISPAPPIPMMWRSRARGISRFSRPTAPTPIHGRAISRSRPRASWSPRTACWCSPASPFRPTRSAVYRSMPRARSTPPWRAAPTPQTVGQLELTRFPNEAGLNAIGGNVLLETPASGSPQAGVPGSPGYGTIQQGFLETSNVNSVNEITALITAQRAYEMNSKVITAADPDAAADVPDGAGLNHDPQTLYRCFFSLVAAI